MRVYESLAASLAASGVDTSFGLVGEANIGLATALVRRHRVRYVAARREDSAVAMADGYARATGRIGVATVTHGPGLTNTATALTEAARAGTPLLLLAGAVAPADQTNRQRFDQQRLAETCGAATIEVRDPATAVLELHRALAVCEMEQRPVVLSLPVDVQQAPGPAPLGWQAPVRAHAAAPGPAIEAAAAALRSAQRPVILAGRGAVLAGARPELERLADATGAILATTLFAKGFFRGNPHDVGVCGGFSSDLAERLISGADCVVAFGASLNRWTTAKGKLLNGTVIQCDTSSSAIGLWMKPALALIGDASLTAAALSDALAGHRPTGFRDEVAPYDPASEFADKSGPSGLDPHPVCVALDRLLPPNRRIVVDVGHFMSVPSRYISVADGRGYLSPSTFGSIGLSLAMAIGAAVADPTRPTACLIGDGGLAMCAGELDTMRRYGLPALVVVFNDSAYGAEVHLSKQYGLPDDLAWFDTVDFAGVARGFGLNGLVVKTLIDLDEALAQPRPALLDVRTDARITTKYYRDFAGGHRE